jgi:hypothetical protein
MDKRATSWELQYGEANWRAHRSSIPIRKRTLPPVHSSAPIAPHRALPSRRITRHVRPAAEGQAEIAGGHPVLLLTQRSHFFRVIRYMRGEDYATAGLTAAAGPAGFMLMEKLAPSFASRAALQSAMRLMGVIGLTAGFLRAYNKSSSMCAFGFKGDAGGR